MSTTDKAAAPVAATIRFPAEVFAALKDAKWAARVSQNEYVVTAVIEKIKADGIARSREKP